MRIAFWLLIAAYAIGIIAAVVDLALASTGQDGELRFSPNVLTVNGVLTIVLILASSFLPGKVLKGAGWARVVVTVLNALAVVGVWIIMRTPIHQISAFLLVVVIALLWLAPSNEYFRPSERDAPRGRQPV